MNRVVQIIVTPGSGEGRALHTARRLEDVLAQRGDEVGVRTYRSLAALAKWAKTCEPDFTHLVCVGGDGTLSAAAAASVRLARPFVPVPSGFGNILARSFGHPRQPEAVADLLDHDPSPSEAAVREALSGNLCRCTGYQKIMDAVSLAAERKRESDW